LPLRLPRVFCNGRPLSVTAAGNDRKAQYITVRQLFKIKAERQHSIVMQLFKKKAERQCSIIMQLLQ
jgi:hypothetical protein